LKSGASGETRTPDLLITKTQNLAHHIDYIEVILNSAKDFLAYRQRINKVLWLRHWLSFGYSLAAYKIEFLVKKWQAITV
jgi:hypothetical protein